MVYERSTLAETSQFTALAKAIRYARFRPPNEKRELSAGAITGNADLPSGRGMGRSTFRVESALGDPKLRWQLRAESPTVSRKTKTRQYL
jgi:hypothetical protein